ncbi:MAG: hypothetical protein ACUVRA_04170 [Candidatus Bathyarchaeaceae archaeon]
MGKKLLAVPLFFLKPKLITFEACHRLALIEGQKEIARRTESRAERERKRREKE